MLRRMQLGTRTRSTAAAAWPTERWAAPRGWRVGRDRVHRVDFYGRSVPFTVGGHSRTCGPALVASTDQGAHGMSKVTYRHEQLCGRHARARLRNFGIVAGLGILA